MNARAWLLGLRDAGFRATINLYPVAVIVDKRKPDGQLVAQSRESAVNNWPLVGFNGHEMPSLAIGLMII
jgi:hypothetical protein